MPDTGNVLSAKLEVKDSFTSQLNKFKNALNNTENSFNDFAKKLESTGTKIEKTLDKISSKMDQTSNKIISQSDKVANSIIKSSDKVEQSQNKAIDNISKKYTKMGGEIETIFKNVQKEAEQLNKSGLKVNTINSSSGGGNSSHNMTHGGDMGGIQTQYAMSSLLGGDFQMMLMNLGIIGGAILGANKILTSLDGYAQQGFNALNTLSTGLLSVDGLKEGLENAGEFQTNRIAMDVLYGNNPVKGQQYYQMGTILAKNTPYSEVEVGALQKKFAGAHIEYNDKDLMTLLDIASVKPELGADHVGFSIVDAMYGRSTSLKTNYMLDNKEMEKYLKSLQKSKDNDDRTNSKKWKDAFTKTGTVGNKQEYFDLLIDYVQKETKYSGLTDRYAHTVNGLIDRLSGNWETLRADLLGIDANGTGLAKTGKITVFSSIEDFVNNIEKWLADDKTKSLLEGFGNGLGKGVNAITTATTNFLGKVKWDEVGAKLEKIGDSIANVINKITSSPEFMKFIDNLPDVIDKILKNQAIKTTTETKTTMDVLQGDYGAYAKDWTQGKSDQAKNLLGLPSDEDLASAQNPYSPQASDRFSGYASDYITNLNGNMLTDANADTYLNKSNLNESQKTQISDLIKKDDISTYNITIQSINANNFDEIMASIKNLQKNK